MKARTEALLPGAPLQSWISTFHSLCVRLLRREAAAAGLAADFVIYDEDDQLQAVREALKALDLPEKLQPAAPAPLPDLRRARTRAATRRTADERLAWPRRPSPAWPSATTQTLRAANALDFDDLLLRTVPLLDAQRARCGRPTGGASATCWWTSTRTRTARSTSSSATWRDRTATSPWSATRTSRSTPGAGPTSRTSSTSSTTSRARACCAWRRTTAPAQAILDAASAPRRPQREAQGQDPARGEDRRGSRCACTRRATSSRRRPGWSARISAAARRRGRAAVLFRMNAQSRLLEEALMRHGMPYVVVGGVGLLRAQGGEGPPRLPAPHPRTRATPSPCAASSTCRPRGIGARTVEEIERVAAAARASRPGRPWPRSRTRRCCPRAPPSRCARFRELMEALRRRGGGPRPSRTCSAASWRSPATRRRWPRRTAQESQDRLENLAELLSAAADYEARDEAPTLAGFLDQVSLLSDSDQVRDDAPVMLMTLHSAKGLEFDVRLPGRAGGGPRRPTRAACSRAGGARGGAPAAATSG